MQWTIHHPTDSTLIARYGHDGRRGIYVEVEDDGTRVVMYEAQDVEQAILDVLDLLAGFGFVGGTDVDAAREWLATPTEWRRGLPEPGVRTVLRVVEALRDVAGA